MRYLLLASALVAFAPAAFAQTAAKPAAKPAMSAPAASTEPMPTGYTIQPADPNNCGTPDQPKPCNGKKMMAPAMKKPSS